MLPVLCPIELAFIDLADATRDLVAGRIKLALCGGTVGIGKSEGSTKIILEYTTQVYKEWQAKSDEQKEEDWRRTRHNQKDGTLEFEPPFTKIPGGKRGVADLFCALYRCSCPGEIGIADDVPSARYKHWQEMINDAADATTGRGNVSCSINKLPDPNVPSEYAFNGALLIIHNWTQAEVEKYFHARVLSRAGSHVIHFPTEPWIVFNYVFRKAISEKSLMPYLMAPDIAALGAARGLGCSQAEAEEILDEVGRRYHFNRVRPQEHSFRVLRGWCFQRKYYPKHWIRRTEARLGPWPKSREKWYGQ
jgi:hypothetical protein